MTLKHPLSEAVQSRAREQADCGWPESALFGAAVPRPGPRRLPFLLSAAAHAGLLFLASRTDFRFDREPPNLAVYDVQYIRLRVPEPIYYRSSVARSRHPRATSAASPTAPAARSADGEAGTPRDSRRFRLAARFELPGPPGVDPALILQPEIRLAPPIVEALPPVALWARQSPPGRPPRRLVLPGRTEEAPAAISLAAPPVLAAANRESVVADLNVGAAAFPGRPPALPVPPAATIPVRLRGAASEPRGGPLEPAPGEAANVIALSAAAMPASRVIAVPHGINLRPAFGEGSGDDAAADTGAGGNGNRAASRNSARGAAAGSTAPAGSGRNAAGGNNAPDSSSGEAAARGNTPGSAAPRAIAAAPALTSATAAPPASATPPAAVTRVQHPAGGLFDVVVMQSSAGDELPEAGGVLTGSPVYTVYLPVGGEREWRLQFCLPGRAAQDATPSVYEVNADDTAGLAPPYPILTVVPSLLLEQPRPRHAVLHGRLTAAGRLRNVAALDPRSALAAQLIPLLDQWEFRPARKDDRPVEVEVLLAIPPRT